MLGRHDRRNIEQTEKGGKASKSLTRGSQTEGRRPQGKGKGPLRPGLKHSDTANQVTGMV
jgi:hypothetical protein